MPGPIRDLLNRVTSFLRTRSNDGGGGRRYAPTAPIPISAFDPEPIFRKQNYGFFTYEADPSKALEKVSDIKDRIRRDPAFYPAIQTRTNAASKADWRVAINAEEGDSEAERIGAAVEEIIFRFPRWTQFLEGILLSRIFGPTHTELKWGVDWWGTATRNVVTHWQMDDDSDYYRWHDTYGWCYLGNEHGIRSKFPGLPLDPYYFDPDDSQPGVPYGGVLTAVNAQTVREPWGWAILEGLYLCYLGKKHGFTSMIDAMRRFSLPVVKGSVKDESQRDALLTQLANLRNGWQIVTIEGQEQVEIDAGGVSQSGGGQIIIPAMEYFDRLATTMVLHQSLATMQGDTGTYAQARVHDGVRMELLEDDMRFMADVLNYGTMSTGGRRLPSLVDMILYFNGWGKYRGRIRLEFYIDNISFERTRNPMQIAGLLKTLNSSVAATKEDYYRLGAGIITRPNPDTEPEEVVSPQEAGQDAMGGMLGTAGMGAGFGDSEFQRSKPARSVAQFERDDDVEQFADDPGDVYDQMRADKDAILNEAFGQDWLPIAWAKRIRSDAAFRSSELARLADLITPYLTVADAAARSQFLRAIGVPQATISGPGTFNPVDHDALDWWQKNGMKLDEATNLKDYYWDKGYENAQDLVDHIADAVQGEFTRGHVSTTERDAIAQHITEDAAGHLETILRTNMARVREGVSYDESKDSRHIRGWVYRTLRDDRVRDSHRSFNGLVVDKHNDPKGLRERLATPNGFNCRCFWIAIPHAHWEEDARGEIKNGLALYERLTDDLVDNARPPEWRGGDA